MFKNMIARWKLGVIPFGFLHKESKVATKAFEELLMKSWDSVTYPTYEIEITSGKYRLTFWNKGSNCVWADRGSLFTPKGKVFWDDERPSADAMYRMKQKLEQWQIQLVTGEES